MRPTNFKITLLSCALILPIGLARAETPAPVAFDHAWISVSAGAPERAALKKAGFTISPLVNRHDGQGTASVTAAFKNAYLELIWVEPTVSVEPGAERAVTKFHNRTAWRTNGWCPIGIGLRRTTPADPKFPFPTWSVSPGWLPAGSSIEILTARDDTKSPSLFLTPRELALDPKTDAKGGRGPASALVHPLGVKRVTRIRLLTPADYKPVEPLDYLQKSGVIAVQSAKEWVVELTFDGGAKGKTKDLRPDLPLVVKY
jgi:hypothetical protein